MPHPDPATSPPLVPPTLATWLLERRLHPDEREELLGDLAEQFGRHCRESGARHARRWYRRQAAALLVGFALERRDVVSTTHERRRVIWGVSNLMTDLRHAWRGLRRSPSFALVAALTLTCGIGLSTAVFSLVGGIVVQPLPFADADRLVRLAELRPGAAVPASGGSLADTTVGMWLERHESLEALSWYTTTAQTVLTPSGSDNLQIAEVGRAFFDVLGTTPVAGRLPVATDADAGAPVVVVSERLWRRALGGSHEAIGRTITIDRESRVVAAVVPQVFAFPSAEIDVWMRVDRRWPAPGVRRQVRGSVSAVGLLRDGRSPADAEAEGLAIAQLIALSDPSAADGDVQVPRIRVRRLQDDLVAPVRPALLTLAAGMALVLVAGCVNLANLLLARHTARQRELGVRLALGAGRWRIARPVLLEQLVLIASGATAGGGLAWWLVRALPVLAPPALPRLDGVGFDGVAFLLVTLASLLTTVTVGCLPALRLRGAQVRDLTSTGRTLLAGAPRSADALRGLLVTGQVALAVVLLVGALLIGRSMVALLNVHPGYQPEGVLTFQASFPGDAMRRDGLMRGFYTDLLDRVRRHPAVLSAGYTMALPLRRVGIRSSVNVVGRPMTPPTDPSQMAISQAIDAQYLRTVGTRVLRGRAFTNADTIDAAKVLIIDETVARRHFGGEDPLGRQLVGPRAEPWTIVGVAEAIHATGLAEDADPVIYYHAPQRAEALSYFPTGSGLAIRVAGDPLDLVAFVREQARAIDPTIPLFNVARLSDQVAATIAQPRFVAIVLGLFAALALSTALLGLYGVLAYAVQCRRTEFGIRRALGATERHIVSLVARRGVALTAIGLAIGLAGGAGASRFMAALLFGVRPADPVSYVGASVTTALVLVAATWLPLRRALRIDPARALRVD